MVDSGGRRGHAGKIVLIVVACVLVVAVAIGGIAAKYHHDQEQWMRSVAYSKEADKIFRKTLKKMDPKAFTPQGVIRSYTIDERKITHNPMGGIDVTAYVNNDQSLYVFFTLERNGGTGPLEDGGGGNSAKLEKMLDKAYPHLHQGSGGEAD
ncbi:DUF1310 family protein [Bifidobacterium sp. ESL0690]|uniref:DUF1310 family protein n=1 Tax=Bifidobacterium sp. ESL0690 TaxID=2983214 RepID=UPI0023FA3632|nr:DUF1310 family protein [Bifidobacterium sp. ESL0690]WEV46677.1 DUF1310 family protein [Bifidobacterium sp. ESL0690]